MPPRPPDATALSWRPICSRRTRTHRHEQTGHHPREDLQDSCAPAAWHRTLLGLRRACGTARRDTGAHTTAQRGGQQPPRQSGHQPRSLQSPAPCEGGWASGPGRWGRLTLCSVSPARCGLLLDLRRTPSGPNASLSRFARRQSGELCLRAQPVAEGLNLRPRGAARPHDKPVSHG